MLKSAEPVPFAALKQEDFRSVKPLEAWGRAYACAWLKLEGVVPQNVEHPVLVLENTGECLLYTEQGVPFDAVTFVKIGGDLPQSTGRRRASDLPFKAGERFTVYGDCGFNGFIPMQFDQGLFRGAWVAEKNEEGFAYYYDYLALLLLADATEDEALSHALAGALRRSFLAFQKGNISIAREMLAEHLKKTSADPLLFTAIGHGHLDLAWLWPIRETVRKAARTYSIALKNIEKYPWYIYGTSQPQQLMWMKESYPSVFAGVKKAIADGRIEAQGGFFAECDTNLPSGESLIRQALYGKRAWKEEFSQDTRMCWLPDAFGYSGNLPQILKKCGMDYFSTIKLSWNRVNVFPYRTFYWQGIDGSRVLVHMPPEGDYNSAAGAHNLLETKKKYPERELDTALLVYGTGDGGGGPNERHVELIEREWSLHGLPRVAPGRAIDFFDALAKKDIPHSYAGELYLETHQGTYTTQGKNKFFNRLCERLLHEAEAAGVLTGKHFPKEELDDIWREVLLYQFHDIIPGSSIKRVYDETTPRYEALCARLNGYVAEAFAGAGDKPLAAVNLTSFHRDEFIKRGETWYRARVSPYAAAVLEEVKGPDAALSCTENSISNGVLTLTFGKSGEIASCKHKNGRELSGGFLNRLTLYQDRFVYPFNAWDIDQRYYKRGSKTLRALSSKTSADGMRVVRKSLYKFGKSTVVQDVILDANSETVRFETYVDWRETFKMLRADFMPAPEDYGDKVRCEIQFGSIERPTTENDSVERAQFEICAHKYVAVRGERGGFALLNDCKYGHRAKNGRLSLNLLRSPVFPDPKADKGEHRFTYAFCPFEKEDLLAPVREGYRLNSPLRVAACGETESRFSCENPSVVIETVKSAENGSGVVLRLYEALGENARTRVTAAIAFEKSLFADMLENPLGEADLNNLSFTPHEVKTILLTGGAR
ncbi:MAG: glycoside hydrolase family 38 C-terminal domain-containing protein [Clostridiaceae bacterium]